MTLVRFISYSLWQITYTLYTRAFTSITVCNLLFNYTMSEVHHSELATFTGILIFEYDLCMSKVAPWVTIILISMGLTIALAICLLRSCSKIKIGLTFINFFILVSHIHKSTKPIFQRASQCCYSNVEFGVSTFLDAHACSVFYRDLSKVNLYNNIFI